VDTSCRRKGFDTSAKRALGRKLMGEQIGSSFAKHRAKKASKKQ
jgi:hypothetical protein